MNSSFYVIGRFVRNPATHRHSAILAFARHSRLSNLIVCEQNIVILPAARSQKPLLPDDNMLRARRKDGLTEYEKNIEHDQSRRGALRRARTQQPETLR